MKPKWHFAARTVLFSVFLAGAIFLSLFLFSFIIFILRLNRFWELFGFGWPGVWVSSQVFPWVLVFLGLVLIIALELLVRRFGFVWKKPVIYSLVIVSLMVLFSGYAIDAIGWQEKAYQKIYNSYIGPEDNKIQQGTILEVEKNKLKVITPEEDLVEVILDGKTHFPKDQPIEKGDEILILGEKKDRSIEAKGLKKVEGLEKKEEKEENKEIKNEIKKEENSNNKVKGRQNQ